MNTSVGQITLKRWGNSLAVRIPSAVVTALALKEDSRLHLSLDAGRVVLEPQSAPFDIDALIAQITPNNRHSAASVGQPVGREVW